MNKLKMLKELCDDWYSGKLNDFQAKQIIKMIVDPDPITEEAKEWAIKAFKNEQRNNQTE